VGFGMRDQHPVVKAVGFIPPTSGGSAILIMSSVKKPSASRGNPGKPTQVGFGRRNGRDAPTLEAQFTMHLEWARPTRFGASL